MKIILHITLILQSYLSSSVFYALANPVVQIFKKIMGSSAKLPLVSILQNAHMVSSANGSAKWNHKTISIQERLSMMSVV